MNQFFLNFPTQKTEWVVFQSEIGMPVENFWLWLWLKSLSLYLGRESVWMSESVNIKHILEFADSDKSEPKLGKKLFLI